jgi:hypothetical protein
MAGGGEAEKWSITVAFPWRRRDPVVGGGLEVLLQHEGSRGMRQGRWRRTAMTGSVSSQWRGKSVAAASVFNGSGDAPAIGH